MKKSITILILFFFGFYLNGQEVLTLSIDKINSKSLSKGDPISVNIELDKTSFLLSSFQMYMKYDPAVLKYQSTQYINEKFADNWHDNNNAGGLYAVLYVDMKQDGFEVPAKTILCELEFIYLGGSSDLKFGQEEIRENEIMKDGKTKFTDTSNSNMPLNLLDGCVCSFE